MDVETIINKYRLIKVEKNGRQGVQPLIGRISKADADYILSHKDEIMSALDARRAQAKKAAAAPTRTAALIAYEKVAAAEAKYRQAERNDNDSVANIIAARDAYEKALREWQAQYPEEAAKSTKVHYNDAPADPWTN